MKRALVAGLAILAIGGIALYALIAFGLAFLFQKIGGISSMMPIAGTHAIQNITYCSSGGTDQKLDIYIPDQKGSSFPLVVYVHGGSWNSGSRNEAATASYLPQLAQLGYVVASIDYRLAPKYTFPAQVIDTKCAIRFLRSHATSYQINAQKIGIIGESAGGYLAAFAGVTGDNPDYKVGQYTNISDAAQAVVDISGPTDFTLPSSSASLTSVDVARAFLGNASPATASVVTHVTPHAAPFYIVHGANDTTVPPSQSEELTNLLTKNGVPAKLVLVQSAGHSIDATSASTEYSQIVMNMLAFLNQHLKG